VGFQLERDMMIKRRGRTVFHIVHLVNGQVERDDWFEWEGISVHSLNGSRWEHKVLPIQSRSEEWKYPAGADKKAQGMRGQLFKSLRRYRKTDYNYHNCRMMKMCKDALSVFVNRNIAWEASYTMRRVDESIEGTLENSVKINEEHEHLLLRIQDARDGGHSIVTGQVTGTLASEINVDKVATLVTELEEELAKERNFRSIAPGVMPVIFARDVATLLIHELIGHMLEENITQLQVLTTDVENFPVMQDSINVRDVAGSNGSFVRLVYDQEGRRAKDITLIERGKVINRIGTIMSSKLSSRSTPGCARAATIVDPPMPRMRNLILLPGESSFDEVAAQFQCGICASRAASGAILIPQQDLFWIEIENAQFIESGELGSFLHPIAIMGSIREFLTTMLPLNDAPYTLQGFCSKAGQSIPVSMTSPSVYIPKAEIVPMPQHPYRIDSISQIKR